MRRRSVEVSSRRPRAERKSAFVRAAGELGPRLAEVARDPVRGLLAERDDAVLRALALADVDVLLLEVDVAEIEADGLDAAQPRRVDELEQRAVAERERAAGLAGRLEDRLDLVRLRRVGQPAAAPRRERDVGHVAAARASKRSSARTAESRRAAVAGASFPPGRARPRSAA